MNNEVAEFLKRAAQRRAQLEQQARAQAEASARSRTPVAKREEAPILLSAADEVVEAQVIDPTPSNRISADVQRDFAGSNRIGKQGARLGKGVDQADDVMEAHLHQAFDHTVGTLKGAPEGRPASIGPSEAVSSQGGATADSLRALLKSPAGMRNAVLLNEILRRPTENW